MGLYGRISKVTWRLLKNTAAVGLGEHTAYSLVAVGIAVYIKGEEKMDQIYAAVDPLKQFSKDSVRLVKRCTKPDRKEFQKIAVATAIGFGIMGFIGFFVKLIHIPINNIIVGS